MLRCEEGVHFTATTIVTNAVRIYADIAEDNRHFVGSGDNLFTTSHAFIDEGRLVPQVTDKIPAEGQFREHQNVKAQRFAVRHGLQNGFLVFTRVARGYFNLT